MLKKLKLILLLTFWMSSGFLAQEVVLSDEFDNGDGKWNTGWIDDASATVTFSIDSTGKLSGANSYKATIVKGGVEMWRVQRVTNLPLVAGYKYTISLMAVADGDAAINVLFEIQGSPYTKRLNDTAWVTTTPQTFTYSMTATENVPDNQVKLHFGSAYNDNKTIWVDNIIVTREPDPSYVTMWGATSRGYGWPILNREDTPPGNAGMGADGPPPTWATIRGSFGRELEATTEQAVVVTGQFEYVGEGPGSSYVPLRYALTYQPDEGSLINQYTDSARWTGTGAHYGYEFTPRSGTTDMANGAGGSGTVWTINGGSGWNSTWSNNGKPLIAVEQAPDRAVIVGGVYDFAISVQPLPDGTNEIRWYMFHTDKKSYWFGGVVIDSQKITTKFNGICFGVGDGITTKMSAFKLYNVRAQLGSPITVPEAPWEPFYVEHWGKTSRGKGWPILNTPDYPVGDAAMGSDGPPKTWATIRGGFPKPVEATTDKAIIITGQFEYVGDGPGASYVPLRYALTYQPDPGTLVNEYTPDAEWTGTGAHYGYEFTPRSGTTDMANGAGGSGTVWTINGGGGWNSTWSNNGKPLIAVEQAPARALIIAGVYDFAISVRPLPDGTNEIRWYMVHSDKKSYWFGGIVIDSERVTTKFNGICFGIGDGITTNMKQFNLYAVKVDKGDPITIPEAPWQPYYVADWGFIGAKTGGWKVVPGDVIGNATVGGEKKSYGWTALRGGFQSIVDIKTSKALVVTGKMELVGGGFEGWSSLRIGLGYNPNPGKLNQTENGYEWAGSEAGNTGYLFIPHSGRNDMTPWGPNNVLGTVGAVVNNTWLETIGPDNYLISDIKQKPKNAIATAGMYDFAFSIKALESGKNEVRFYIRKEDGKYNFGGIVVDNLGSVKKVNSINFAISNLANATKINLYDVYVDLGNPITIPDSIVSVRTLSAEVPTDYYLGQNYPNPFNPTTTIEFALPEANNVKLVVYDALGREVSQLVNEFMNAGNYKVTFNAQNLASGVYFYTLKAGDFVSVKKLVLIK